MKRFPAILTCLLAVTIDAFATVVASGTLPIGPASDWQLAAVLHVVSVVLVGIAVARYRHRGDASTVGTRTVAILAITLTLCAPVAGALAVACLLAGFATNPSSPKSSSHVIVGNPLRPARTDPSTRPLVRSMNANALSDLRQAGPLLHRNSSHPSITILRQLQRHSDARTQLQAQGAMTSLSETSEKQITQFRQQESGPENSRRLASLLHQAAISGMRDEVTSQALLEEAIQLLEKTLTASPLDSENITALQLLAECHLASDKLAPLPGLIDQLRNQTDGAFIADRIERRYHAAVGQWRELAASVHDTCLNTTVASRNFWAGSPPVS